MAWSAFYCFAGWRTGSAEDEGFTRFDCGSLGGLVIVARSRCILVTKQFGVVQKRSGKRCHIPVLPALGRWRQEDFDEFKAG